MRGLVAEFGSASYRPQAIPRLDGRATSYILVYTGPCAGEDSGALSTLLRVVEAFEANGVAYAIVGGYAVALHGAVRGTVDVDAIIKHTEASFAACEKALRSIGLIPRLPVTPREVFQFRAEYISRRNLIAWSFYNPTNPIEVVDIIITHDLAAFKAVSMQAGLNRVRVLSLPDLIAMKRAAGRPQDLEDVKMLEKILGT